MDWIEKETTERKRINNINEIYDGKKLLTKEFVNLDLSNIDLSIIPKEEWEDCIFYNTSFKNTGIKFIPNKLKSISLDEAQKYNMKFRTYGNYIHMDYCDFSDNDLTYLEYKDFCFRDYLYWGNEIEHCGCDFSNTGINYLKNLRNLKLDCSYDNYEYEYFLTNCHPFRNIIVDLETIIKNPNLKIPSSYFAIVISCGVSKINKYYRDNYNYNMEQIVLKLEEYLEYDKQGHIKKLYNMLKDNLTTKGKYKFFSGSVYKEKIENVVFRDIPIEVLDEFHFDCNQIKNVTFDYTFSDLLKLNPEFIIDYVSGVGNTYTDFFMPKVKYSSWQENVDAKKRIATSKITFFTKVYLELSRLCNAKCQFCRNNSFDNKEYNLENIIKTLEDIKQYINALVIGGGEPTLKLEDVKKLRESILDSKFDWHMFTNGSNKNIINDEYIMENFKLNVSRHAVNDIDNANIFKINNEKIMNTKDLEEVIKRNGNVTLNAVCFDGGLDNEDKIIEYINYAKNIGCNKVLIQDLQQNLSLGIKNINNKHLNIESSIIDKVRDYLKINGYREKNPIYATGGYVSYILKNKDGFQVTLQKYINQQELDKSWSSAIKRTFDLSIDPSGNLYENWNQQYGLVKTKKK